MFNSYVCEKMIQKKFLANKAINIQRHPSRKTKQKTFEKRNSLQKHYRKFWTHNFPRLPLAARDTSSATLNEDIYFFIISMTKSYWNDASMLIYENKHAVVACNDIREHWLRGL